MNNEKIHRLATERSYPCVTISMNTHRTHPDNTVDAIGLKNLMTEAKNRIINEFGKRDVSNLLEKIDKLEHTIDHNHNLDSLHIFLSNTSREIIRSPLATQTNTVHVSNSFAIKPLIRVMNQTEEYYILLLSQSGVRLLFAINDSISEEIINEEFPILQNSHYLNDNEKLSDAKQVDNIVSEYFNKVDKAMLKVNNSRDLKCIVICTQDNYSRLIQVADKPSIYYGYSNMNYNDASDQSIAAHAWLKIKKLHHALIEDAINEMQEAVGQGKSINNLSDIFQAAKEGRGDLLITHNDYHQAVKMTGEFTFETAKDITQSGVIDDIISEIAWDVIQKDGRAIFVNQEDIQSLGNISLKIRY
jgi:hypothetical protein